MSRIDGEPPRRSRFATTRWTLVRSARRDGDESARAALAELCEAYWGPIYSFIRRRGYDADQARDHAQAFFAKLLEAGSFEGADEARGRFRGWLLGGCKHYLANARDRDRALKRGGGAAPLPLELGGAEARWELQLAGREEDPEQAFDRDWGLALLERVLDELGAEYEASGQGELFAALRSRLVAGGEAEPLARIAEATGRSEGSLKTAVHRMRRRYGELLRRAVADTVEDSEEVDAEIDALFRAVSGGSR